MSKSNKTVQGLKTVSQTQNSKNLIFDDAYVVDSTVGRGRNSIVYKATRLPSKVHKTASPEVALKVLTGSAKNPEANRARMKREAVAMLSCRHKNIVQLYDFVANKELYYLSMEFCPGGDYSDKLAERGGALSIEEALFTTNEVLSGLEVIHKAGIIHRDIKPENLLIDEKGHTKIADFGIASIPSEDLPIEDTERGVGTFDFLAPELLEKGVCSASSDLYSTGVTLFWFLTGKSPYQGNSLTEALQKKLSNQRPRAVDIVENAPESLERLLDKALHPSPEKRFNSAEEFRIQVLRVIKELKNPVDSVEMQNALSSNLSQMVEVEEEVVEEVVEDAVEEAEQEEMEIKKKTEEEVWESGTLSEEKKEEKEEDYLIRPEYLPAIVEEHRSNHVKPLPSKHTFSAPAPQSSFPVLKLLSVFAAILVVGYALQPKAPSAFEETAYSSSSEIQSTGSLTYPGLGDFSRRVGVFYDFFGPGEHLTFSTNRINTALRNNSPNIKLGLPGNPTSPIAFNRLLLDREASFGVAGIELVMTLDQSSSPKRIFGSYLDLSTGIVRQWSIL